MLYVSPALHWLKQSRTDGEQRQELRDLTRENRSLKRRGGELRDPRALEQEARKLGLVKHGEGAYVIEHPPRRLETRGPGRLGARAHALRNTPVQGGGGGQ